MFVALNLIVENKNGMLFLKKEHPMDKEVEAWRRLMIKVGVKNETIQDVFAAIVLMSSFVFVSTLF